MCTYLAKRGATYYFRRVIPEELRAAIGGKAEFTRSLRTKDRAEAKRLIPAHTARSESELDEARAKLNGLPGAAQRAPVAGSPWASEADMELAEFVRQEEAQSEARQEAREPLLKRLEEARAKTTAEMEPREAAAFDLLRNERAEWTMEQERQLIRRVERAERLHGIAAPQSVSAAQERQEQGVMLDTHVIDSWASERKVVPKGKDTHRSVATWFYARVGRKPVGEITRKDVLSFKDKLVAEGQTPANTNMKLSRLRTLLQFAADNDHAEANVAVGIKLKNTDAAKNKRKEFDLGSLNSIFLASVHSQGERPAGGKGEAAYWLPLLALFTGARLEELGQLRPSDVIEEAYPDAEGVTQSAWIIRILDDAADDLKIKNAESERLVPVHPELARLGFIAFVVAAKAGGDARLFPKLKANIYGRLTAKWGEWFSGYLRNVCKVTDKRMVFHSFRHTFKHYARHAGIIEGVQRQIMGHSSGDSADDYGSGHTLHQVVEGMKLFKVPGLKLPAPV